MNCEIITIGTEILLGEIVDTNSTYLAQQLRRVGLNLYYTTTVGDNEERIAQAIDIALNRADIIITTGGLGPTVDDKTRQAVAVATQHPLIYKQELYDAITERFATFSRNMPENNRRQAYIPQGAVVIENPVGTAPSFIVETERGVVISLPGVPREMKYLVEYSILPYLQQRYNAGVIKALILRTAGIGESAIDEAIDDLMQFENPTVGLAAHVGQADIRITAKAIDEPSADEMIEVVEAEIRARLGDYIYGTGQTTIEEALVNELHTHQKRIAISETGTHGKLQAQLTAAPASEKTLAGVFQFSEAASLRQSLTPTPNSASPELSIHAAKHALDAFAANISIAVILNPEGINIAVTDGERSTHRFFAFPNPDDSTANWAVNWGMARAWSWLHHKE